jgi:hypothetical protein
MGSRDLAEKEERFFGPMKLALRMTAPATLAVEFSTARRGRSLFLVHHARDFPPHKHLSTGSSD